MRHSFNLTTTTQERAVNNSSDRKCTCAAFTFGRHSRIAKIKLSNTNQNINKPSIVIRCWTYDSIGVCVCVCGREILSRKPKYGQNTKATVSVDAVARLYAFFRSIEWTKKGRKKSINGFVTPRLIIWCTAEIDGFAYFKVNLQSTRDTEMRRQNGEIEVALQSVYLHSTCQKCPNELP